MKNWDITALPSPADSLHDLYTAVFERRLTAATETESLAIVLDTQSQIWRNPQLKANSVTSAGFVEALARV